MVRDFKYIIKRIIIGVGITLALMFIKGNLLLKVNAQVVSYKFYDSDYNLLYESDGSYSYNGTVSPVRYARVTFDDDLIGNHDYSLSTQFGLGASVDYLWVYWNNSSGVNINGSYISTSPSLASTSNQQIIGSNTYYKQTNLMFDFKPSSSFANDWFFQLDFGSGKDLRFFDLLNYSLIDAGVDSSANIINNQNINNQNLINNQNQNTQDIIDNQNQNTQDLIDNQNVNTDKEIESQKVCTTFSVDKSNVISNGYLNNSGTISPPFNSSDSRGVTDYINIYKATNLSNILSNNTTSDNNLCFYSESKSFLSCISSSSYNNNNNISIPNNAYYVRFTVIKTSNRPQFSYELCKNGNQALQDTLTDDSGVSDSDISDLFGDLQESNSPVSDLLTLPITLLQAYLTGFEGTCSSYNLGSLYGTNLVLPCIDIPNYIGSNLWSLIDALCCIYMIYNIAMLFVSVYETFTSLDDSMQLLYSPQHSGHTRVSRNEGEY